MQEVSGCIEKHEYNVSLADISTIKFPSEKLGQLGEIDGVNGAVEFPTTCRSTLVSFRALSPLNFSSAKSGRGAEGGLAAEYDLWGEAATFLVLDLDRTVTTEKFVHSSKVPQTRHECNKLARLHG